MHQTTASNEQQVIAKLNRLVDFERQVKEVRIDAPPKVQLAADGKGIQLQYGGQAFQGAVDRPIVHQLGGRIWPQAESFKDVAKAWDLRFKQNRAQLESDIASVFERYDLSVRHVQKGNAKRIYGIVSPQFVEVNQLDFRAKFLDAARRHGGFVAQTKRVEQTPFGNVVEFFQIDSPGFQIGLDYGLVYARNTGYDAFKVQWGRYVLICTNGLKRWESHSRSKWNHNQEVDLGDFLNNTLQEGIGHQAFLEERIAKAQTQSLSQEQTRTVVDRLSLAAAPKRRLTSQIASESRRVGENEWALSQALTYLGSHDRDVSFWTKRQFTDLGTDVLEQSLDEVLRSKPAIGRDGRYGIVLPHSKGYH